MLVWFDRIGLLCQFLSFWCIAPEILGAQRMQKFSKMLATFFSTTIFVMITAALVVVIWALALKEGLHWFHKLGLALVFSSLVLVPKVLFYRKFKKVWLPRLIAHLSDDENFRKGLFIVGAVFLTVGFALQLVATF
jgi:hypothetical protein